MDEELLDSDLFEFINVNFPKCANDLKEGIELLENIIQSSIDTIEEKSGDIIKKERDFKKADEYREKENKLNKIAMKLQDIMDMLSIEADDGDIITSEEKEEKEIPNYNDYIVDSNIQHTLYEDLTHKRPVAFELNKHRYDVRDWKDMLLQTCNVVTKINKDIIMKFPNNEKMNGKKVVYFAYDEHDIVRSPKKIENINLFVSTNHSANSIRNIIINILREYKISTNEFKIYLRADYSELH